MGSMLDMPLCGAFILCQVRSPPVTVFFKIIFLHGSLHDSARAQDMTRESYTARF